MAEKQHIATLSADGDMTCFHYRGRDIRFRTSSHLMKYIKVNKWDNGYLEVMAQYDNSSGPEEEYIDLIPVLNNLYMNPSAFLAGVKEVEVADV